MTTTRLEIADRRTWLIVHRVYGALPVEAIRRLAGAKLLTISDAPHPVTRTGALGVCERYADGTQKIFLHPDLGRQSAEHIAEVVAHELAHAGQATFHGPDLDEPFAQAQTRKWGFDPSERYPKVDWKR